MVSANQQMTLIRNNPLLCLSALLAHLRDSRFGVTHVMSVVCIIWCLTFSTLASGNVVEEYQFTTVEHLLEQVQEIRPEQLPDALKLLRNHEQSVLKESTELELKSFYLLLSEMYGQQDDYRQQLGFARKGLRLHPAEQDKITVNLFYSQGFAQQALTNYSNANKSFQKGFDVAKSLGDDVLISRGELYLASIYVVREQYEDALTQIQKSFRTAEKLGDAILLSEIYNELGLLYDQMGDKEQAIAFYLKSFEMDETSGQVNNMLASAYNVGMTYLELKNYDAAITYFDRLLKLSQQYNNNTNLYFAYRGFASVSKDMGRINTALSYMRKAEEFLPDIQDEVEKVYFYLARSEAYEKLEQYPAALDELLVAESHLPASLKNETSLLPNIVMDDKAKLFYLNGQSDSAYLMQKRLTEQLMKKLENVEPKFAQQKSNFDKARLQIHNAQLQQDNREKTAQLVDANYYRKGFRGLVLIAILMSLMSFFFYRRAKQAQVALDQLKYCDPLTNVNNRKYLLTHYDDILISAKASGSLMSVIHIDIDGFSNLNQESGTETGDQVLILVSQILKQHIDKSDVLVRTSSDQFLVLMPGAPLDNAEQLAERIREEICQDRTLRYDFIQDITASFAVTQMKHEYQELDSLLLQAELGIKAAKAKGKNCVERVE